MEKFKNERLLATTGLADEQFLTLACKYKTYSNAIELNTELEINEVMLTLKSLGFPLSIGLNERNKVGRTEKMVGLSEIVATSFFKAKVEEVNVWRERIQFPVKFYYDPTNFCFEFYIKTQMRETKSKYDTNIMKNFVAVRLDLKGNIGKTVNTVDSFKKDIKELIDGGFITRVTSDSYKELIDGKTIAYREEKFIQDKEELKTSALNDEHEVVLKPEPIKTLIKDIEVTTQTAVEVLIEETPEEETVTFDDVTNLNQQSKFYDLLVEEFEALSGVLSYSDFSDELEEIGSFEEYKIIIKERLQ